MVLVSFPRIRGGDPFRSMMDYFTQDKIATLTAENQSLKFAASQDRQNALLTTVMSQQTDTILNRVNPRPIPAYQVANPNMGAECRKSASRRTATGINGLGSMSMAVQIAVPSRCHASTSPTMKLRNGATAW